jgi:hypothetical protein
MSDYFGTLMNLCGAGARARGPSAQANAPNAGGDIVQTEVVREAVAAPASSAAPHRPPSVTLPITSSAPAESAAGHLPMPAPAALQSTELAPAGRMTGDPPATAVAAPMAAEPHHAIVRAALEWVAGDPHNNVDRRDIGEQQDIVAVPAPADARTTGMPRPGSASSAREQLAPPTTEKAAIVGVGTGPQMEVPQRLLVADVETAITRASPQASAAPAARIVGAGPAASGRVAPVTAADEIVEISIGAIHVRVDAPVPQVPAAPAPSARKPSARSAASSALSRRALRRF